MQILLKTIKLFQVEFEMQILPEEIRDEILYFTDAKTLISIQRSKIISITYDTLKSLLSDKIGIDVISKKIIEIERLITLEYQIFLLTTIGQMYHTGFGLNDDLEIFKDDLNADLCEFIEDYSCQDDNEIAYFDDYMIKPLTNMIIPFHTIILKNIENFWSRKPETEWYNSKSTWWDDLEYQDRLLPFLNTRPYIVINDPYMQVTISTEKKGIVFNYR